MHKVLIIEDTMEMAEILQVILEHMGLTVFHETHGMKRAGNVPRGTS